jgi:lipopolysaccharide cholinephosphotransferase
LDKVDELCRQNEIRYSLGGGTLLGAIRHKGYIPWDDDVDIMMPRPDYEKFLNLFLDGFGHMKIQHYKNSKYCLKPFAKVYDDRTVLKERFQECGVYIDVFPIDGLPEETSLIPFIEEYQYQLSRLHRSTSTFKFNHNLWVGLKEVCKRVIDPPRRVVVENFEKFITQFPFESSVYAGAITGRYAEKEHMEADVFKTYIDVPFEGRTYKSIANYDAYLKKHYGDYMKLPPKEQQISNHDYRVWWKKRGR